MARSLQSGAERVLGCHDGSRGRTFDAHYRALATRLGPFEGLTRSFASAIAALWVEWRYAEQALVEAQRARREGRGRRPSAGQIGRLQRRAGLAWTTYDAGLRRLEELARSNGHGQDLASQLARLSRSERKG